MTINKKHVLLSAIILAAALFAAGCSGSSDLARQWALWSARRPDAVAAAEVRSYGAFSVDDSTVIPAGVDIDGVEVGGMTAADARPLLTEHYAQDEGFNVTLLWNNVSVGTMKSSQLGLTADIDAALQQAVRASETGGPVRRYRASSDIASGHLHIQSPRRIEGNVAEAFIKNIDEENQVAPVDAVLNRVDNMFNVTQSKDGVGVNIVATSAVLRRAMLTADGDVAVNVVLQSIRPKYTTEDPMKIHDVLGTYSTHYKGSSETRAHNVRLASSRLNNLTLMPGDQVSVSELMLPRTSANGYKSGTYIVNGVMESGIGGGVCQVASTLYNALLYAEIQIDERHNHSISVSYLQPGRDATISEDYKDLKFTNNLSSPIFITSVSNGKDVTFTVYGHETRPANRKVDYPVTVVYEEKNPGGRPEMEVYLEKVVTVDGVEVSREKLHQDFYAASGGG